MARFPLEGLIDVPDPRARTVPRPRAPSLVDALTDPSTAPRREQRVTNDLATPALLDIPRTAASDHQRRLALLALNRHAAAGKWPGIRIGVDNTPGGGHQGASVEVYHEIRALGYTGPVQLVYTEEKTRHRLVNLMNGVRDSQVAVVSDKEARDTGAATLAIFGAHDFDRDSTPSKHCRVLSCDKILYLQPLNWLDPRGLGDAETFDARELVPVPLLSKDTAAYAIEPAPLGPDVWLCRREVPDDRGWHLAALLRLVTEHKIELSTVYGKDTAKSAPTLFAAIRRAQRAPGRPVGNAAVLWIGSLDQAVDFRGDLDSRCVKLFEPSMLKELTWLRHGEHRCLLIETEALPQPVFKRLLERSTIPPLIEGANARNFMRVLQKPYMSLAEEVVPSRLELQNDTLDATPRRGLGTAAIHKRPDRDLEMQLVITAVTKALKTTGDAKKVAKATKKVAEFILAARDPASWVPDFFAGVGRQNRLPSSDQLVVALAAPTEPLRKSPALDRRNEQLQELRRFLPDQRASAFDEWVGRKMTEMEDQLGKQAPDCVRVSELAGLVADLAEQIGFPRVWRSSRALERAAGKGQVDSLHALYAELVHELAIARDALLRLRAHRD